jgi:hypothetical protein
VGKHSNQVSRSLCYSKGLFQAPGITTCRRSLWPHAGEIKRGYGSCASYHVLSGLQVFPFQDRKVLESRGIFGDSRRNKQGSTQYRLNFQLAHLISSHLTFGINPSKTQMPLWNPVMRPFTPYQAVQTLREWRMGTYPSDLGQRRRISCCHWQRLIGIRESERDDTNGRLGFIEMNELSG